MAERRFLIDPNVITHHGSITEEDLRTRLLFEAFEQAGWMGEDGKPLKGVGGSVLRGDGRRGGYRVEVSRDLRKSDQARIEGPRHADQ